MYKFIFLTLVLVSCAQPQADKTEEIQDDGNFALSTDTLIHENGTYLYLQDLSDSTYLMLWGKDGLDHVSQDTMPILPNGKLYVDWFDDNAICVRQGCGTGCFFAYILPLRFSDREKMYFYPIEFDVDNHLVAYSNDEDSVITVENYLTGKNYILPQPVKGPYGSFALDSTSFTNKKLYIRWWDDEYNSLKRVYNLASKI